MLRRTSETWNRLADAVLAAGALAEANSGDEEFSAQYRDAIVAIFSPEWDATLNALKHEASFEAAESCIEFLVADPMCFRSGYEKEKVCRILANAELTDGQRQRLKATVDKVLQGPPRVGRELKRWQHLHHAIQEYESKS